MVEVAVVRVLREGQLRARAVEQGVQVEQQGPEVAERAEGGWDGAAQAVAPGVAERADGRADGLVANVGGGGCADYADEQACATAV